MLSSAQRGSGGLIAGSRRVASAGPEEGASPVATFARGRRGAGAACAGPAPAFAATTTVKAPPIVKKYIAFGASRKAQMADYSQHHYGQHTYLLTDPKAVVLHHTDGAEWQSAWNTFNANTAYNNEKPGVSAHFIIDKDGTIYQCVPLGLRARHCIGMNWKSFGIEFCQESAGHSGHWMDQQILNRPRQIAAVLNLVRYLQGRFHITTGNVIGHAMANSSPYFKDYTGARNATGDWVKQDVLAFRARL